MKAPLIPPSDSVIHSAVSSALKELTLAQRAGKFIQHYLTGPAVDFAGGYMMSVTTANLGLKFTNPYLLVQ